MMNLYRVGLKPVFFRNAKKSIYVIQSTKEAAREIVEKHIDEREYTVGSISFLGEELSKTMFRNTK